MFSNDEIDNIIKIAKSLEDAGLSIKGSSKTVKNKVKEQKTEFLGMLKASLGAGLLGNILAGRGVVIGGDGFIAAAERTNRAGQDF